MEQNLFEELQEKKQFLAEMTRKATAYGWISIERQQEILDKIKNDVLTIGVIGQMKCGKSTFLNSFVFEDDILPAATTPMTAALSVITYGENKKIVAEFYTEDEWEEQKLNASRSLSEVQGNPLEESKIKAAKELVEKASKLGNSLYSLLGKEQEDDFEKLIDYVGADGKYIAITKAVTIYYPKEYLKGVEIVDTPGFNDPIVSREERTKAFLKKADVVLMMLYAGRPFDATDRDILFQNVRQCGIGKVIIGINKYDIPYENGETEEEIKDYVKQEIKKTCEEFQDDSLAEIVKQADPIPLSAEMALLSQLPMSKITSKENYQFAWKRSCDNFEINNQNQMRDKSHLNDLITAVKQMVENEKGKILFTKPLNSILAAGNAKKQEYEKSIRECETLIQDLEKPDDELERKQEQLNKAQKRIDRKINSLGEDIDDTFKNIIRKGKNELEDAVDSTCKEMTDVVKSWGRFSNVNTIIPKLDQIQQHLVTRILKRKIENLNDTAKNKIKETICDFFINVEDILIKYIPDFDSQEFIQDCERNIQLEIENEEMFQFSDSSNEDDSGYIDLLFAILNGASWGVIGKVGDLLSHEDTEKKLLDNINFISKNFDPLPYLESLCQNKDKIINEVKKEFITDLLEPMEEQIQQIRSTVGNKEAKLKEAKEELERSQVKKLELEKQITEIKL